MVKLEKQPLTYSLDIEGDNLFKSFDKDFKRYYGILFIIKITPFQHGGSSINIQTFYRFTIEDIDKCYTEKIDEDDLIVSNFSVDTFQSTDVLVDFLINHNYLLISASESIEVTNVLEEMKKK